MTWLASIALTACVAWAIWDDRSLRRAIRRRINAWKRDLYRRRMARDMGWKRGWDR